ncbi:MAG: class I SAM-dependent methyltransferase [Dongiaceae bacterium]
MSSLEIDRDAVTRHYAQGGLAERLLAALAAAGKDPDRLTAEDLAPFDQFHTRGAAATAELAALAGIGPADRVLDVGCGIGGPARSLALVPGCRVTGIDLTPEFVAVATMLADRLGLAGRVEFRVADACALPFADAAFDVAWTQHAAMNIADRPRLYGEIRRILRAGGRLALHDVLAGPAGPPLYPTPWARRPEESFLLDAAATRAVLEQAGFRVLHWQDVTAEAAAWFARRFASPAAAAGPGLATLMGRNYPEMALNQGRNLAEGRVAVLQAVLTAA